MQITATIHREKYSTTLETPSGIFIADEHLDVGGTQKGMNPHELLLSSLATCTAITLRMYADRKGDNNKESPRLPSLKPIRALMPGMEATQIPKIKLEVANKKPTASTGLVLIKASIFFNIKVC